LTRSGGRRLLGAASAAALVVGVAGCIPSQPINSTATPGTGSVSLSWAPPTIGTPVSSYVIAYWRVDEPNSLGAQIVGGGEASTSTYPWMAALLDSSVSDGFNAQFCGGSLIDPSWVLTAAHCVTDPDLTPSEVQVALGHDTLSSITPSDRLAVDEIIVHPDYDAATSDNDAALLHLAAPVTGNVPVLLAHDPAHTPAGAVATIVGWGSTRENGGYPDHLRGAYVNVLAAPEAPTCGNYGADFHAATMLCAGMVDGVSTPASATVAAHWS
jgi:Trypsin